MQANLTASDPLPNFPLWELGKEKSWGWDFQRKLPTACEYCDGRVEQSCARAPSRTLLLWASTQQCHLWGRAYSWLLTARFSGQATLQFGDRELEAASAVLWDFVFLCNRMRCVNLPE